MQQRGPVRQLVQQQELILQQAQQRGPVRQLVQAQQREPVQQAWQPGLQICHRQLRTVLTRQQLARSVSFVFSFFQKT